MLITLLELCGKHARWVLPIGLLAGVFLPWAAQPMQFAIAPCIWLLLFFAVVRLHSSGALDAQLNSTKRFARYVPLMARVLLTQLLFPLLVFLITTVIGLPWIWCVAATLVAAAPPISGSPNLVLLLKGDGALALRWLIVATIVLPISCIPVLYLLLGEQSLSGMLIPVSKLLLLILSATGLGMLVSTALKARGYLISVLALDGASSISLALMVIGLMSGIHAPGNTVYHVLVALFAALLINLGYQLLGATVARSLKHTQEQVICAGVVNGNRNIALYLTALPASFTEPLLLFIACYQVPMYLTPLMGNYFYKAPE